MRCAEGNRARGIVLPRNTSLTHFILSTDLSFKYYSSVTITAKDESYAAQNRDFKSNFIRKVT
jgi:CobQ-like glutamine amidotransferase family enzyme